MKGLRILCTCVLMLALGGPPVIAGAPQPMIGSEAPEFSLPSLSGSAVKLADFAGEFVVLHFGAGW